MRTGRAMRACEAVTRSRARNFWYGIRLLPRPKREALAAVYAMARRIDDVGDGDLPRDEQRHRLDAIEASLSELDPESPDPVLAGLAVATERFPIPVAAFGDLIAGVRMDVEGASYRTADDLLVYCRLVGGSVGRLSLGVLGSPDRAPAEAMADDLGVAMQLTNVLRDIREDLNRGRVYLPAEDLAAFACPVERLAGPPGPALTRLVRFEAVRAAAWFRRGVGLLPLLDRRSAACAGAMAGIYLRLLARIAARPETVASGRVSLPPWEKALVAARALGGKAPMAPEAGWVPG